MNLSHYSNSPDPIIMEPREQDGSNMAGMKPTGLWVSVDGEDDWPSWCVSEDFRPEALQYYHRVILAENHNVLHISTAKGLMALTAKYEGNANDHFKKIGVDSAFHTFRLDWAALARDHDGLIIAPYLWDSRMDLMWYYGWDCASGCLWHPRAVASIEMVRETDYPDLIRRKEKGC